MSKDPYSFLNEKNAVMMNCKNPSEFNKVYEETLQKHYQNMKEEQFENIDRIEEEKEGEGEDINNSKELLSGD